MRDIPSDGKGRILPEELQAQDDVKGLASMSDALYWSLLLSHGKRSPRAQTAFLDSTKFQPRKRG